jgi:predicted nucleotidyltransferase
LVYNIFKEGENMEINKDIENITQSILNTVNAEKIYLFGSYAYGQPNEDSDYDFYVVIPDGSEKTVKITQNIYRALRGFKNKPVDILVGYLSNFEKRSELPTIERTIKKDGILLYGQNRYN